MSDFIDVLAFYASSLLIGLMTYVLLTLYFQSPADKVACSIGMSHSQACKIQIVSHNIFGN